MAHSKDDPNALLAALGTPMTLNPPPPNPAHKAFSAAGDLYLWFLNSAFRIAQYANITLAALSDFEDRGFAHLTPAQWSTDDPNSMGQVLIALNRKSQVDFLKEESENAEAHVFGQAAVSLWGVLEVFVEDLLLTMVSHEPSRIAKVPQNIKVPLSEFYGYDDDKRIAEVVRLVAEALASALRPGVGAFEPMLNAFGLGGEVDRLTKETILEFVAVRNCIVHRKGIVDAKFKKACGTSTLNIGDPIRLSGQHVDRYVYAGAHYAATVIERVMAQCAPDLEMDLKADQWLESLKKAAASQAGPT